MTRPIRLLIHALGGQGGGVLADWIVAVAEATGWRAQSTSVPGVAQRTGATLYYLELAPPGARQVLALMPTPGDVDIVVAAELMEAGRAIARGFVTSDRTTLIASSHRVLAIAEKSAMGSGIVESAKIIEQAEASAARFVVADYAAIAERHRTVISAAMLGAIAGAGVLPFEKAAFAAAIEASGKGVKASMAAFEAACSGAWDAPAAPVQLGAPGTAVSVEALPAACQAIARHALIELTDYQDRRYAALYLDRLLSIARADEALGGLALGYRLTCTATRHLALWMRYEDVIRVADIKTRRKRLADVADEAMPGKQAILHVSEFMHPRYEELVDLAPRWAGGWLSRRHGVRRLTQRLVGDGVVVRTSRLSGFVLLWTLGRLRRFRRMSVRYAREEQAMLGWIESAVNAARTDYALGVEVLRLQRLIKGYSDTHARGYGRFARIMSALPLLLDTPDPAGRARALHDAALSDEEGVAFEALMAQREARHQPALVSSGASISLRQY